MLPDTIIALVTAIIKLITLLLESTPIEQRKAQMIAWWSLWWPIGKVLLPKDAVAQIEQIMSGVK